MTIYLLCLLLFCVGIYGILSKRNIIRMIVGISIAQHAIHLFFLLVAYRHGGLAPELSHDAPVAAMVDPLPQALVLTAIVIGLATTGLLVALAMRLHGKYGTYDIARIRELRG